MNLKFYFLSVHSLHLNSTLCHLRLNSTKLRATDVYEGVSSKDMYAMFDALLEKHVVKYTTGDRVVGTVVSMDKKFVYLDMGLKDYALLPREEVSLTAERAEVVLPIGDSREFLVIHASTREVQLVVSLKALEMEAAWERARQQFEAGATLDVTVVDAIKGGYRVDMGGLKSFLPASQIHPQYL